MSYLLDTDWAIQALHGRAAAVATLGRLTPHRVAVSVVTLGELHEGAFRSSNPIAHIESLRRFLHPYPMLNLNEPIMQRFGEYRAFLRRRGALISDFDIIIGATAVHHGLTVLTFNVRHLERIPDVRLYEPA